MEVTFCQVMANFSKRYLSSKSSAVAEMGDCLATIHMGRKVGAAVPLSFGELDPHLTHDRLLSNTGVQNHVACVRFDK